MTIAFSMLGIFGAFLFATFIYVVLQALVGWKIGASVERISVGTGPVIFTRTFDDTEWSLSLLPLGGYTKFHGDDDQDALDKQLEHLDPRIKFTDLSVSGRMVLMMVGPISMAILGIGLLCLPVLLAAPQLTADGTGIPISPVSVPAIGLLEQPSTPFGQWKLVEGTAVRFWREAVPVFPSPEWGGPISWMYSTGIVAEQNTLAWVSLAGATLLTLGLLNLAPIPVLNGGSLMLLFLEGIGLALPQKATNIASGLGLIFTFALYFSFVLLDFRWFF